MYATLPVLVITPRGCSNRLLVPNIMCNFTYIRTTHDLMSHLGVLSKLNRYLNRSNSSGVLYVEKANFKVLGLVTLWQWFGFYRECINTLNIMQLPCRC